MIYVWPQELDSQWCHHHHGLLNPLHLHNNLAVQRKWPDIGKLILEVVVENEIQITHGNYIWCVRSIYLDIRIQGNLWCWCVSEIILVGIVNKCWCSAGVTYCHKSWLCPNSEGDTITNGQSLLLPNCQPNTTQGNGTKFWCIFGTQRTSEHIISKSDWNSWLMLDLPGVLLWHWTPIHNNYQSCQVSISLFHSSPCLQTKLLPFREHQPFVNVKFSPLVWCSWCTFKLPCWNDTFTVFGMNANLSMLFQILLALDDP